MNAASSASADYGEIAGSQPEQQQVQYRIHVRQQALRARMCGFGEKDRRSIDPPPIVQLEALDEHGVPQKVAVLDHFYVVHCTLWCEGGLRDRNLIKEGDRMTRVLVGSLVSSPAVMADEYGDEGCYFSFPDLSCRTEGKYRLKFMLARLSQENVRGEHGFAALAETMSDVFQGSLHSLYVFAKF